MKAFWDKALSEISFRFQEVWFVDGADAMIGEIGAVVDRVKSKLYICAPRLDDIDFVPIKNLSDRINVRIAANIDPSVEGELKTLAEFIDKPNFAFRHYPDENIWGVSKDLEEIILGAVSGLNVAGIGSIIDEHIKNFNPVLEGAWMKGRPIKSIDDARLLQVKRMPRTVMRELVPTTTAVTTTASTGGSTSISPSFMSDSFAAKKQEVSGEIILKLDQLKTFLSTNPLKRDTGVKLEELKEFIINSYGFSRLVFDISKVSRNFVHDAKNVLTDQEIQEISQAIEVWKEKL